MSRWLCGVSHLSILVSIATLAATPALAASFTVNNGQTVGAQTVTGTDTGTIAAGGTVSAASAITWASPSAAPGVIIDNAGTIIGSTRGIDTSGTTTPRNITVINRSTGTITGTGNDGFRINADIGNGTVSVTSSGGIFSAGGQAIDFAAITSTTGTVNIVNNASGTIRSTADDALRTSIGGVISVSNSGLIESTAAGKFGVYLNGTDLNLVKSFTLTNAAGAIIRSSGSAVLVDASSATRTSNADFLVDNSGTISATATSARAIDFDHINAAHSITIINRATGILSASAADAVRPGEGAVVTNYGTIFADGPVGSSNDGIDFQNHSGVVINKTGGTISGFRHGITTGGDVNLTNEAGATLIGRNGSGFGSDGTGTVVNYGRITGAYNGSGTGDGDGVDVDFTATITNYGVIEGTGAGGYDSGNRLNNSEGISIGGGTILNYGTVSGASYGIVVNNDSNVDNSRSGSAATTLTNYGSIVGLNGYAIRFESKTGTSADNDTIVNYGTITGNGAIPDPNGIVLRVDGTPDPGTQGRVEGINYTSAANAGNARFIRGDGSAIQMGQGNDQLTNYGTIIGNNGRAINMEGGNDTVRIMPGSKIVGLVNGGTSNPGGLDTDTDTLVYGKVGLTAAKMAALQAGQTVNIGGTLYTGFEAFTGSVVSSFSSYATGATAGIAAAFDNTTSTSLAAQTIMDQVASSSDPAAAMAQLTPTAFQALTSIGVNSAFQTTANVDTRLSNLRNGGACLRRFGSRHRGRHARRREQSRPDA